MISTFKNIIGIVFSILNIVVLVGTMMDFFRYYIYAQLIIKTSLIIGFSIYGFEELRGFGMTSIKLGLGYTYLGFMIEIADLVFWLTISCAIFSKVREEGKRF